jgi:2-succinyl-6-hydroxy-2,4-cyclohexadiene-1-carboxylate synthase
MEIVIEGVHYHIETCGEGNPLLLLHGFTGDSSTWLPFCENWGKHSKLIIPDLIGHGKTDAPKDADRYQIEAGAKDLLHILEKLDCKKVDVLGYSMGGRLALTFAILYPEKVNRLILESSSPGLLTETERLERRMKDGELADFIIEKGMENFVDYWENIPLFSTMRNLPQKIKDKVRQQRLSHSPQGLANSLVGMGTGAQPSWWGKLEQVDLQVLLLTGEKDEKFCRIAEKMQKLLKNSNWMVIENSGHALHVEVKEKFGTIVSEFLLNT